MAFSRKVAKDKVVDLSPEIMEHMLKIFVLNSPENFKHWCNEINNWFRQIDKLRLKPNRSTIEADTLYHWIVFDSAPHYDVNYVLSTVSSWKRRKEIDVPVNDFDAEFVLNKILSIVKRIANDISKDDYRYFQHYLN